MRYRFDREIADGVNRLFITRYKHGEIYRLTTSKPGHKGLVEQSADASSGSSLTSAVRTLLVSGRTNTSTGSDTTPEFVIDAAAIFESDIGATVEADLHSKWSTEVAGAAYYPSMMQFDGSTGYYSDTSVSDSGNKVTFSGRFSRSSFTGDVSEHFIVLAGLGGSLRLLCGVVSSNHTTVPNRAGKVQFLVQNSSSTTICLLVSDVTVLDGEDHTVFAAFDGDNGTAVLYVDGLDADDTGNGDRVAPTTGTLEVTNLSGVGASHTGGSKFGGKLGPIGYRDAYLTNYSDFINADDSSLPAAIDEKNWSEWDGRTSPDPGMTEFDGSTSFYSFNNYTSSGNKVTGVVRFNRTSFTGDTTEFIARFHGAGGLQRLGIVAFSSDNTSSPNRADCIHVLSQNSSGTVICRFVTPAATYLDGNDHVLFYSFDGDAGTAVFRIDGVDADDATNADRVAPTTGTLESDATSDGYVGANGGGSNLHFDGTIGFFGYKDAYLTNHSDFSTGSTPADIDEVNWTEWGGQPEFWNRTGEMADNKGSAGNMTINGTIKPPRPLFWSHTGDMTNNKGSAGDMTENGTITMTEGGSP